GGPTTSPGPRYRVASAPILHVFVRVRGSLARVCWPNHWPQSLAPIVGPHRQEYRVDPAARLRRYPPPGAAAGRRWRRPAPATPPSGKARASEPPDRAPPVDARVPAGAGGGGARRGLRWCALFNLLRCASAAKTAGLALRCHATVRIAQSTGTAA